MTTNNHFDIIETDALKITIQIREESASTEENTPLIFHHKNVSLDNFSGKTAITEIQSSHGRRKVRVYQ